MHFLYPPLRKCNCSVEFSSAAALKKHVGSFPDHSVTVYDGGEKGDREPVVSINPEDFLYPAGFLCRFGSLLPRVPAQTKSTLGILLRGVARGTCCVAELHCA